MRVLLLGGGGYLGRAIAERLRATRDIDVLCVARTPMAGGLAYDAQDTERLRALMARARVTINATSGPPAAIRRIAASIAAAAPAQKPFGHHVIELSSVAVYRRRQGVIDESAPLVSPAGRGYGAAKRAAELILEQQLPPCCGLSVLRLGAVVGGGSPRWERLLSELLRRREIGLLPSPHDGQLALTCRNALAGVVAARVAEIAQMRPDMPADRRRVENLVSETVPSNTYLRGLAQRQGCRPPGRFGTATVLRAGLGLLRHGARGPVLTPGLLRDLTHPGDIRAAGSGQVFCARPRGGMVAP